MRDTHTVDVGLTAVIMAVSGGVAKVLAVREGAGEHALPSGLFDPAQDRTLNLSLRRWIMELTALEVGYVEQLYTFGNQYRDARELDVGARFLSIGYLGLAREQRIGTGVPAEWHDIYDYLPWEDWRGGRPAVLDAHIMPALAAWAEDALDGAGRALRRGRIAMTFGTADAIDHEKALQRFELMYEAGLLPEAHRDYALVREKSSSVFSFNKNKIEDIYKVSLEVGGLPMKMDHRRILASALERVRGKIKYRPLVFELLPAAFTLLQLQKVVEALSGVALHKQNFRRLIQAERLVEETGEMETTARGRPAALFRFRPQVLSERPAPGVGVPKISTI
ncbi:MAG: NAD regulator [Proteobacteria bacterium]|nr:NAD regulator [Pseudomonadota bacterium]